MHFGNTSNPNTTILFMQLHTESHVVNHKNSNISHTLVGSTIVDLSDAAVASPVGAAPITSSFWLQ